MPEQSQLTKVSQGKGKGKERKTWCLEHTTRLVGERRRVQVAHVAHHPARQARQHLAAQRGTAKKAPTTTLAWWRAREAQAVRGRVAGAPHTPAACVPSSRSRCCVHRARMQQNQQRTCGRCLSTGPDCVLPQRRKGGSAAGWAKPGKRSPDVGQDHERARRGLGPPAKGAAHVRAALQQLAHQQHLCHQRLAACNRRRAHVRRAARAVRPASPVPRPRCLVPHAPCRRHPCSAQP